MPHWKRRHLLQQVLILRIINRLHCSSTITHPSYSTTYPMDNSTDWCTQSSWVSYTTLTHSLCKSFFPVWSYFGVFFLSSVLKIMKCSSKDWKRHWHIIKNAILHASLGLKSWLCMLHHIDVFSILFTPPHSPFWFTSNTSVIIIITHPSSGYSWSPVNLTQWSIIRHLCLW